jgi:hypothetical protein
MMARCGWSVSPARLVLAGEMRGEKRAESSQVFQEHESFVEFGRHLARVSGIEETFRRASYVSGQVSARHNRDSPIPGTAG